MRYFLQFPKKILFSLGMNAPIDGNTLKAVFDTFAFHIEKLESATKVADYLKKSCHLFLCYQTAIYIYCAFKLNNLKF